MRRPQGVLRLGRRSWILNSILGVVLLAVIVGVWFTVRKSAPTAAVSSRTATVQTGSVTATVTGSGNLASARTSSLSFGASGKVTKVYVEAGDKVTGGAKLATIDTASAQQNLKAAQAQLVSAQAQYDDAADSASTSAAGQADAIDAARLSLSSSNAAVKSAQQQLKDDTTTQNQLVAEAESALSKGGTQSRVDAANATRHQVIARDQQGILQAKAQVATAKSNLAKAKSGGSTSGSSSSSSSTAQIASAEVSVEEAKSSVQDAKDALADTTVTAPFSGTITAVNGQVGDQVSAGSSSSSAGSNSSTSTDSTSAAGGTASTGSSTSASSTSSSAFITMASEDSLDVTASIAEADIGNVKVGQDATVTLAATGDAADGKVTQVAPEGTTSNNVVQYSVTVTISDPPSSARLGNSVSVVITTGTADNVLTLATSAITTTGNRSTVQVLKNGAPVTTLIQTGLKGTSSTEITSGLSAGDVVQLPATSTGSTSTGVPGFGRGAGGVLGGPR